jgi:NADH dehydrogenase/NADH:ubiquinone oxidoreductase subunit G
MIELYVQGRLFSVADDAAHGNLLEFLRHEGYEVPSLCYHEALRPYGACRLCLVEVARRGRPGRVVAACTHPVLAGLEISLDTDRVVAARRLVLELLLAHAPGAPRVREVAARYGIKSSRFAAVDEPKDCILCGVCEQVCRDVVGAAAISLSGRGVRRSVATPFRDDSLCLGCGTCDLLCPTGVLTMQKQAVTRFRELPGETRRCRYNLVGLLPGALCANDFRCDMCETEQQMLATKGELPLLDGIQPGREVSS